jgi:L-iditol 2-dehydrogenase
MLLSPRRIELQHEPEPQPEPGGIVVRVRAALTDGTDLKAYRRGHPQMPMPTRFGHEFSGDVAAVGTGVTAWRAGDAVMCVHSAPCGRCYWCANGEEELCVSVMSTKILGAYADYVAVPAHIVARNCFRKPADVPYPAAAFLEPLACVVHSVAFLGPSRDATVAVLGDGGFGILHALLLRHNGVRAVLAGRRPERLELARALAIGTIDTAVTPVGEALLELTGGRGADAAIECTGSETVWESAPDVVRRGGTVSFFGGLPAAARISFSAARLHYDQVRLVSPFHFSPRDVCRAFHLIAAGAIPVMRLLSHAYRLDEIAKAFAELDAGAGLKILIEPCRARKR